MYIDLDLHSNNIISDPLELFFQEIELGIKTAPNEIWGIKDSINLNRYLFNKYVTITQIKNEIKSFIGKNCQHSVNFQYNISVEIIKNSDSKDLIYIVVKVQAPDLDGDDTEFLQKFLLGS